ncbi:MAG: AMP-binding protein [Chromatiales bacterium]|jgi:long-chain acyl-CoA synthetase|nr:AMP-binding protein [Chromatiales bacterium]
MKLGNFLADCARRYPQRVAMVCGDETRTFAQLDSCATRLANALRGRGLRYGDRVALLLPNCLEAVELMCALGRAGAVIVPISNRLAAAEVSFILGDCRPRFFVYHDADAVAHSLVPGLQIDAAFAVGAGGGDSLDALLAEGNDDAIEALPGDVEDLVLGYTSGTTGNPKGAIGTHACMVTGGGYMSGTEFGFTRDDKLLITSPIAHRVGLTRVINVVCLGLSAVLMTRFDPTDAVDLIERHQITTISVVPTIARLLAPELERRSSACRSLTRLMATGEAFPVPLKQRLHAALPWVGLHTSYAQTEAGLVANLRPDEQLERPDSVGRPIPGVEVRLIDAQGHDVSTGEPGEVLVRFGQPGGPMVMRGYFERPEENAKVFMGDWLRTGDICRADEAGYLYFVDRLKDMIVSGGLNIYAKEVELAISAHGSVADAAVIGVADEEFGESVLAFVELEPGSIATEADIIEHCKATIASYKKPRSVRFVAEMPRTASGKVRKAVLKATL